MNLDLIAEYVAYFVLFYCTFEACIRVPALMNVHKYKVNPLVVGFEAAVFQGYALIAAYLLTTYNQIST